MLLAHLSYNSKYGFDASIQQAKQANFVHN